ncbi:guanine nucleotide-binding protein alpha-4 subunit [Mycena rosella]|uniref:Guanine nucleotide-binding protein alpha-4 subunit n=1 Tax=Mycena rosella TaxID=1033263 RepID=A0AAD7DGH0_MYCRO|nr:guanine nucleotide-binding protein alpha-4 subunit [Mycena rosella]
MTVASDIDPLSLALAPPPGETPQDRDTRLQLEREAKKRSDLIDQELARQRINDKKTARPVKILLLGQSESGKSTTLKNFQLINSPKAFRAELASWRAVVHLNVVRSIRLIISALAEAEAFAASGAPPVPDEEPYPALSPELLTLKMRLLPLQQVEEALLGKLSPGGTFKTSPDSTNSLSPLTNLPQSTRGGTPAQEVYINSTTPWKGAFSRLMNNVRTSVDGPEVAEPQDSRDARQLLHACSEDMIRLWNDPTVKAVLKVHRLRLEDMAGFFLDSIERVTSLSYQPTDGVSEHHFNLKAGNMVPQSWIVYDVGGARSLVSQHLLLLSSLLNILRESLESVNRLEDSILLWKAIVMSPLLKDTSLILFLNKCDILKAKLASGQRFGEYVVSYGDRVNDFEHCTAYMKKKFTMIAKQHSPEPRGFYTYFTSVTDVQSTADILGSVRDMLVRQNLTKSRLV